MKAIRKSDGKVIEVETAVYSMKSDIPYHKCISDGKHYLASDLDFDVEEETDTDLRISVAKLREILERLGVDEYNLEEIIEKVKSEI